MAGPRAQWKDHVQIGDLSCAIGRYTAPSTADHISLAAIEASIKKWLKGWSPRMVSDPIKESLLQLIVEKNGGKEAEQVKDKNSSESDAEEKSNVIDIRDALKQSVAKELKSLKAQ